MSKTSSFRGKLEQLARHRDENQYLSDIGEGAGYVLYPRWRDLPDSVMIARRLIEAGLRLRTAHGVIKELAKLLTMPADERQGVAVRLPDVPNPTAFEAGLQKIGVIAERRLVPDHIDVAAIRQKLGLSQDEFALRFGLDVATIRNWEQGRHQPDGASRVLLRVIERHPAAVECALVEV